MSSIALKQGSAVPDVYDISLSVGEILRRSRMHYNLSLKEVERALRIRALHLEAIELDNFDLLPGKVYALGFIRSYADYLGLDAEKMIKVFKAQSRGRNLDPELSFLASPSEKTMPPLWLVIGSLLAFCLVWFVLSIYKNPVIERPIPPVPERLMSRDSAFDVSQEAVQSQETQRPLSTEPFGPPSPPAGIMMHVTADSWIEIKNQQGAKLVSRILKVGEEYFIPNQPGLLLSVGNASGIDLQIGDVPLSKLGQKGQVIRDINLDIGYLLSTYKVITPAAADQTEN